MLLTKFTFAAMPLAMACVLAGCTTTSNPKVPPRLLRHLNKHLPRILQGRSPRQALHGTATSVETPFTLQIDGETVTGTLFGNAASHSLIEQFPLTLTFRDHGGQEKLARLPKPLPLDDVPAGDDADPLTIGYYAPDQVLVLYYEHVGYFNGIVRIGTFDDLSAVRDPTGPLTATINLA